MYIHTYMYIPTFYLASTPYILHHSLVQVKCDGPGMVPHLHAFRKCSWEIIQLLTRNIISMHISLDAQTMLLMELILSVISCEEKWRIYTYVKSKLMTHASCRRTLQPCPPVCGPMFIDNSSAEQKLLNLKSILGFSTLSYCCFILIYLCFF